MVITKQKPMTIDFFSQPSPLTSTEFFYMAGNGTRQELVKGVVIEMPPPEFIHGSIASQISWLLANYVKPRQLGRVAVESGYKLERNPDTVRGPDVSFVSANKLSTMTVSLGYPNGAPDLAVEIVSPANTKRKIEEKVQEYLNAGSQLVWVVRPKQQTVTIYNLNGTVKELTKTDILSGEAVLPGFSCQVAEIFE